MDDHPETTKLSPYEAGAKAREDGKARSRNPYGRQQGSSEYEAWNDGWDEGHD